MRSKLSWSSLYEEEYSGELSRSYMDPCEILYCCIRKQVRRKNPQSSRNTISAYLYPSQDLSVRLTLIWTRVSLYYTLRIASLLWDAPLKALYVIVCPLSIPTFSLTSKSYLLIYCLVSLSLSLNAWIKPLHNYLVISPILQQRYRYS